MNKKGTFCSIFAILLFFMTVSCKVDLGISEKKMAAILTDFYLADGVMFTRDIASSPDYLDSVQVYTPILKKHGYSIEDFRSSLYEYMKNPKRLEYVYSEVLRQLTELQSQFSHIAEEDLKKSRLLQQEDSSASLRYELSIAGDTVRAWW